MVLTDAIICTMEIIQQDCCAKMECTVGNNIFVMATYSNPLVVNWIREPDLLLKTKKLNMLPCHPNVYGNCPYMETGIGSY